MPMAYEYARQLAAHYPEANADIVLPAILLHDVGYTVVPEELQMKALAGSPSPDKRWDMIRLHEVEGANIANKILTALNYDPDKIAEIQQIINGHDSRQESLSLNDALVKDADKLWRYAPASVRLCARWNQLALGPYLDFVELRIEPWFFTDKAKEIARSLLTQSRQHLLTSEN